MGILLAVGRGTDLNGESLKEGNRRSNRRHLQEEAHLIVTHKQVTSDLQQA